MFYSIFFVTHLSTFAKKEIDVENNTSVDEVWRKLSGFGGKYQISSYGRVRTNSGDTDAECRPVSIQTDGRCPRVALYGPDGVKKVKRVADLVADAFLWNPNGYRKVVCLDGNTYNVHLDNLMWVSDSAGRCPNPVSASNSNWELCSSAHRPYRATGFHRWSKSVKR